MARLAIYLPDELHQRLAEWEENWSAVCREAIAAHVRKLELRKNTMLSATERAKERLKISKQEFTDEALERGREIGATWAADDAEYWQLKALADSGIDDCETIDALGPPGVVVPVIDNDYIGRTSIENFWQNLGYDLNDPDLYSAEFWLGFVDGAVELFEEVGDDL